MWPVDTLGDWLLAILEIDHINLFCGLYRTKFTYNVFQWKQDMFII